MTNAGIQLKPTIQAMLIADHVYQDRNTGKYVVAGIFNQLVFQRREDAEHEHGSGVILGGMNAGSPFLYLSMAELLGFYRFELRFVKLDTDQILFQMEFGIESKDPLEVSQLSFGLPPLPSVDAGVFALELLWNQEPLGSVRIIVKELKNKGDDNASGPQSN
jgi:hypothetical protein